MRQTWRWFGPGDIVSTDAMAQAGVQGVVSALHQIAPGEIWTAAAIETRKREIATFPNGRPSGLNWEVVESLPVSEDIKRQSGDWRLHLENYKISLTNLAGAGLSVICYNFMPVLDWTRTDLAWPLANGATAMRFDLIDFAVFDLCILARPGAADDFPAPVIAEARARFAKMSDQRKSQLTRNIVAGLPGAATNFTLDDVRGQLERYKGIDAPRLRQHFTDFLQEVIPHAETLGLRLCCHPDDPPFPLLGLPRIMSTKSDHAAILNAVASPANGITLCSGSLGVRADNDLVDMMTTFGARVHFLHLRNTARGGPTVPTSFYEAEHLEGDTDMVALVAAVLSEEEARRRQGRQDHSIPFRPDHGQNILDDLTRNTQPGYPAIGRLKGLAELRGIIRALEHQRRAET